MKILIYEINETNLIPKDQAFINMIKKRIEKKETLNRKQFDRIRKIERKQNGI